MGKTAAAGVAAAVIIMIAAAFLFFSQPRPGGDSAIAAKLCGASKGARIFKCENSTYLVAPLIADVGSHYVDSNGDVLAQCNGFINKPNTPECMKYQAYSCDRSKNLCGN
ncbi:MAG TPA: hypothetical protein PLO51_00675 [Candidatus Micrarchaeota archaeon]|nr:hypothetical protein [Candidatus Micrarchaeota archaeon]